MSCFYLCIVVFLCAVRSCGGLQAAGDYDVYSSYSYDDDEETTKNAPVRSSIAIGDVLKKLGILGAVGGGAYASFHGFKLARRVLGRLYDERKERRANAAADASSRSKYNEDVDKADRDRRNKGTKSSPTSSSSTDVIINAGYDTTALDELKKEQEELWRFLHSLFKNQDEIIAKLDKLPKESSGGTGQDDNNSNIIPDSMFRDFSHKMKSSLSLLSARLDSLDNKLTSVEDQLSAVSQTQHNLPSTLDKMKDVLTPEEVKQLIRQETQELNDALLAVRNDVKLQLVKYLKEHDEVVVEKIKSFGEEMKKIVKGSTTITTTASKSSSSGSGGGGGGVNKSPRT